MAACALRGGKRKLWPSEYPRAGFVHQGSSRNPGGSFVQQYLWGLLGTRLSGDWEMDKSQQSLQADRITHREFLYDVTDGWIGCHG